MVRKRLHALRVFRVVASVIAVSASCGEAGPTSTGPTFDDDAEVRVLFVGNSLTYVNDLPGMVATISAVVGAPVSTVTIADPNYSLQDHWASGIAGRIRELRPTVVVMQQGPSSLPESRANLVEWTDSVAKAARAVGATPALLMVWPELARFDAFAAVRDSYREAADHVDGTFIPAGEAFRVLHQRHPELEPYGPDGFHPSLLGSVLSAFVVVRSLLGRPVTGLPDVLDAGGDTPRIALTLEQARVLTHLADSVGGAWASATQEADRAAILAIYERTRAAHFDKDPEAFLAAVDSAYWVVGSGDVRRRGKVEATEELRRYFRDATFTQVADVAPPRVTIAPSGDVAWLIGQVEVRGELADGRTLAFRSAWVDIFRKRRGRWWLEVHANTQRALPPDAQGGAARGPVVAP